MEKSERFHPDRIDDFHYRSDGGSFVGSDTDRLLNKKRYDFRHDTIAISALEHEIERLRGLAYTDPLLTDGGSTIGTDGKIGFTSSAVSNYSASVSMANEEQSGKTYYYDVRWNITTITGTGSNMKKITIAAQQQGGNWRFKPVQLSILKCR